MSAGTAKAVTNAPVKTVTAAETVNVGGRRIKIQVRPIYNPKHRCRMAMSV
jgi:hypothetical protein